MHTHVRQCIVIRPEVIYGWSAGTRVRARSGLSEHGNAVKDFCGIFNVCY